MNNSDLTKGANPGLKADIEPMLHDEDQIAKDEAAKDDDCNIKSGYNPDAADDKIAMECGIGSFRPACLQPCVNMYCFVLVYSFAGLTTACLRVYISTQISALERQFGFSSTQSGFLLACNDIGFLTTVLFVSHYLRNSHAPRALSFLNILYGLSGLICALPYFLGSETIYAHSRQHSETLSADLNRSAFDPDYEYMCQNPAVSKAAKIDTRRFGGENSPDGYHNAEKWTNTLALGILATGLVIQGAAKSAKAPIICTYVDDNSKQKTGQFIAIYAAITILGIPVGFACASLFSRLYFTLGETDLTPEDPRWIGAWWLGFLVFGIAAIIFMVPVMLFPRRMQQKNTTNANKPENALDTEINLNSSTVLEKTNENKNVYKFWKFFKGLFSSAVRILRRTPYVLFTTGFCLYMINIAGMLSFTSKYIEMQFFLPAWKSNAVIGLANILALSGGTLIGGFLTSKFKVSARGGLVIIAIIHLIGTIITPLQIHFGCDLPPIVGPETIPFRNPAPDEYIMPQCVSTCSCDEHKFLPVCFNNSITYFSPCFAGCQGKNGSVFIDCTCLTNGSTISPGFCDVGCNFLYYYLAIFTVYNFFGTMTLAPVCVVLLRTVGNQDRGLAVGIAMFCFSLLGWTCGPILYGMLIDAACLVWSSTDNGVGACSLYDNTKLRINIHAFSTVLTFLTCLLTLLSLLAQIRKEKKEAKKLETQDRKQERNEGLVFADAEC